MSVHELHQLSQLIEEIGDCFMVRRTLDRLESGELSLQEAIVLLRSLGGACSAKYLRGIALLSNAFMRPENEKYQMRS